MEQHIQEKIESILNEGRVVLFMKGTPQSPQCGFSARAVAILNEIGAQFSSFNVFDDQEVREGIKEYGNWPTVPQLYVDKKLVGGSDIMMEMFETGELKDLLQK
jgi:monothiol glutaredoxin